MKKILVKEGKEYLLVWLNNRTTQRKLKSGIYIRMPSRMYYACIQGYIRKLKPTKHRKRKYQFEPGDLPNVVAKVTILKP